MPHSTTTSSAATDPPGTCSICDEPTPNAHESFILYPCRHYNIHPSCFYQRYRPRGFRRAECPQCGARVTHVGIAAPRMGIAALAGYVSVREFERLWTAALRGQVDAARVQAFDTWHWGP